jgi:SAM-dependent methyltransferase
MGEHHGLRVQYGCGQSAPAGWSNFDSSMRLRIERIPLVGRVIPAGPFGRFPSHVSYGDIVKGLPLPPGSVSLLYCSHVLEHLSLTDFRTALQNSRRVLKAGGVFRLVMPDLQPLMERYVSSNAPDAAVTFMLWTGLGRKERRGGLLSGMIDSLRNSQHLWLWDYRATADELAKAGFRDIRRAQFGDSGIEAFNAVENQGRWDNALGIQCMAD